MTADKIDLVELAAMAKPIRDELGWARTEVAQLMFARSNAATKEERDEARRRLPIVRARRDAYKRLLSGVQSVIDAESGSSTWEFAREFLESQVVLKTVSTS